MRAFFLFVIAYMGITLVTPFVFFINLFKFKKPDYIWQCAIGFDQAGGSVLYNEEDWTISSYTYYLCYYHHKHCWFMRLIEFLFGKGHCERSYKHELQKIQKEAKNGLG